MNIINTTFGINSDTIAAVATPAGVGGIGIVRISGPLGERIARKLFSHQSNASNKSLAKIAPFTSHRLVHGYIRDFQADQVVDEVLMVVMKGPHSYTREDVVEIQAHGGVMILSRILELVIQCGARLAEPGEFTRRAFLNGRIDLSQAEAVSDIINAKSKGALAVASHHLQGTLGHMVAELRETIVPIIADLEAGIEFPEDVGGASETQRLQLASVLENRVIIPIEGMIESFKRGRVIREGLRVVIVGRPNVGKSSLMNCLVGREKAIVTSIPGTTRDTVEEMLHIGNIEMHVSDTAGLHESTDPVEIIGMRKTRENIALADIILMVVETHKPINREDLEIIDQLHPEKTIVVRNKVDLGDIGVDSLFAQRLAHLDSVSISAKKEEGVEDLKKRIAEKCAQGNRDRIEGRIVANIRHQEALVQSLSFLKHAYSNLTREDLLDMVSMDLTQAVDALGSITGERLEDEVLDSIFSNFCVGK